MILKLIPPLGKKLGLAVTLNLLHDASAAALAVDEVEGVVVLTLGTAVGNGFPALLSLCP